MVRIWFVRHGRRQAPGAGDKPLSNEGRVQAECAARALSAERVAAIHSSSLRRASETAEILGRALGLPVVQSPLLRERANFGDDPRQTRAEFDAVWERCNRERDFAPPVGDSSLAAGRRIEDWVRGILAAEPQGDVVAVTHGGVLADFLRNVCTAEALAAVNPDFARRPYDGLVMRECSITLVRCEGRRVTPVQIAAAGQL